MQEALKIYVENQYIHTLPLAVRELEQLWLLEQEDDMLICIFITLYTMRNPPN